MNTTTRILLIACLSLPVLAGCQNGNGDEETEVVDTPMSAPTGTDQTEWNAYLTDVVTRNLGTATSTYVYTLPPVDDEDFEGAYERQLEKASADVGRGVNAGTLLAFGSSSSERSADLAVSAFAGDEEEEGGGAGEGALEGVRVLFIGDSADNERVQAAVEPSGAEYVFVEAD